MAAEPRSTRRIEAAGMPPLFDDRSAGNALAPYTRALRRHWLIATLVLLTTLGASIGWLSVRDPVYVADAEILLTPVPADDTKLPLSIPLVRDTGDDTRTIQTAAALVDTHQAAVLAARRMGAGYDANLVEKRTDVQPQGQTQILEVTAEADDRDVAAKLADTFVDAALEERRTLLQPQVAKALEDIKKRLAPLENRPGTTETSTELELQRTRTELEAIRDGRDPTLSIAQSAVPPRNPVGLPAFLVLALAGIAGLVLAAGTALLVEVVTPSRISSEDELTDVYGVPILARIPRLPRSRSRPTPGSLDVDPLVREAFRTLQVQLEVRGVRRRAIMMASASRGDGKTTAAATFALELASSGALVIAIDGDLRKPDLGRVLGVPRNATPIGAGEEDAERPRIDMPAGDPLKPVPGHPSMWLLDLREIVDTEGAERYSRRLKGLIAGMLNAVDYVVVDTSPLGEVSDALMLIDEVDDVVLVSRLGNTRRLSAEVARDLLGRSGVDPTGMVVIGGRNTAGRYPYGGG